MLSKTNSHSRWMIVLSFIMFLTILSAGNHQPGKEQTMYQTMGEQEQELEQELELILVPDYQPSVYDLASVPLLEQPPLPDQTASLHEKWENEAVDATETITHSHVEEIDDLGYRQEIVGEAENTPKAKVTVASVQQENNAIDVLKTIAQSYDAVEVTATGYFAGRESTGKDPGHPQYGITYSGLKVRRDSNALSTIAADIKVFPLGTVLYIPGYGYGIVADTGSAIKGHIIDLYFETIDDVFSEWGKKKLDVYVIEQGEGKITEETFKNKLEAYRNMM